MNLSKIQHTFIHCRQNQRKKVTLQYDILRRNYSVLGLARSGVLSVKEWDRIWLRCCAPVCVGLYDHDLSEPVLEGRASVVLRQCRGQLDADRRLHWEDLGSRHVHRQRQVVLPARGHWKEPDDTAVRWRIYRLRYEVSSCHLIANLAPARPSRQRLRYDTIR